MGRHRHRRANGKRERKAQDRRSSFRRISIGGGLEQAAPDEVMRAIGRLPPDLDWSVVASSITPLLPRRRPLPPQLGEPVCVLLPPGVMTGFGIDIGPAVLHIGSDLLETWSVDVADLTGRALENLRDRHQSARPRDIVHGSVDDVPLTTLQSQAGASGLLLIPDELKRLFGEADQCFIAPMRDLLISMPLDTDREFVAWVNEEFAAVDPNALALEAFTLRDGVLAYERLSPAVAHA